MIACRHKWTTEKYSNEYDEWCKRCSRSRLMVERDELRIALLRLMMHHTQHMPTAAEWQDLDYACDVLGEPRIQKSGVRVTEAELRLRVQKKLNKAKAEIKDLREQIARMEETYAAVRAAAVCLSR